MSHYLVAAILSSEGGIAVRNGCFCAHPYLFQLLEMTEEQSKSYRSQILSSKKANLPGLVRVSFGCYNTESEVDWLVEMLERILRGQYKGRYIQDQASGEFHPEDIKLQPEAYFQMR